VALTAAEVVEFTRRMLGLREQERPRLDLIHCYLRDDDKLELPGLPSDAPQDVKRLARISRVNLLKYVVAARVQQMYVNGFQTPDSPDDLEVWRAAWQANRWDARQIGVHRATVSYGTAYETVLPGTRGPVMRGHSPRDLTAAYGDDDEWPELALWKMRDGSYRLIDQTNVYRVRTSGGDADVEWIDEGVHGMTWLGEPVCPVVRFRDTDDLDDPGRGIVQPLFWLQDQVNVTTFQLLVAQHYGAFRQRLLIGWAADSEAAAFKSGASVVQTLDVDPSDIQVHEFAQNDLRMIIESREATIRHLATVSQTPVHELLGQLVNLSAEALEAARAGANAAAEENRTVIGESHEQALNLAAEHLGLEVDEAASVVWKDTRLRSLQETIAAWSQAVQGLGVPEEETWSELPVPQHKLERWRAAREANSLIGGLGSMMGGSVDQPVAVDAAA
jgi:predicted nuclease of predicted toxin-antitoxin system